MKQVAKLAFFLMLWDVLLLSPFNRQWRRFSKELRSRNKGVYTRAYRKFVKGTKDRLHHLTWSKYLFAPKKFYSIFKREFNLKFNRLENEFRRLVFDKNVRKILDHNQQKHSFRMSINQFSALTDEEFHNRYLSNVLPLKPRPTKRFLQASK